jgi:transcriptional regulator with PAS, ATPase and Fis domain
MAKSRKINNALTRVFDQSSSIVYLISDDCILTYANEACASLVGIELESLVGTQLVFSTDPLEEPSENAAKGLAISPSLFTAPQQSVDIRIFSDSGGNPATHRATANAIFDHRGVLSGYLVVGEADISSTEPNVRASLNEPTMLHEALAMVRQRNAARFSPSRLVGTSAASDRVRRQVQSAAESESDVLIVGPVGSGREHIARTVFARTAPVETEDVSDSRLIPLHCSITDPAQIQSTMKELLREESRSTLMLIDVDQMGAGSQQEILGYLQLPGTCVRMIATSSRKLVGSDFGFDQNLASRLSTLTIELPGLAERREDLPLLAQAILEAKNDQSARQFSGFTRQALEMICEFDWPGNFGQLAAAIDEAAVNADGPIIKAADFAEDFQHSIKAQRFAAKQETTIQLDQYLHDIEEQLVFRAISEAKGNKTKAAELLGISRAKLLRRLAVFEKLDAPDDGELLDPSVFKEDLADD